MDFSWLKNVDDKNRPVVEDLLKSLDDAMEVALVIQNNITKSSIPLPRNVTLNFAIHFARLTLRVRCLGEPEAVLRYPTDLDRIQN